MPADGERRRRGDRAQRHALARQRAVRGLRVGVDVDRLGGAGGDGGAARHERRETDAKGGDCDRPPHDLAPRGDGAGAAGFADSNASCSALSSTIFLVASVSAFCSESLALVPEAIMTSMLKVAS